MSSRAPGAVPLPAEAIDEDTAAAETAAKPPWAPNDRYPGRQILSVKGASKGVEAYVFHITAIEPGINPEIRIGAVRSP